MYDYLTGKQFTGVSIPPPEFEHALTDYFGTKFSEIANTGRPSGWPRYTTSKPNQISIRNDETSVTPVEENATILRRSQYAIDYFIKISSSTSKTNVSSFIFLLSLFYF